MNTITRMSRMDSWDGPDFVPEKKDFDISTAWNGRSYPLPEIRDHLPFADAAVLMGMSLQLVSTLVKTGKVRGNSIHKTVRLDSLDAYLETRDQPQRRSA